MVKFWAKTTKDGQPGISVLEHMLNVGFVARCFAELNLDFITNFGLTPNQIGALAALHDLGKISPGFQRKCLPWLQQNNLINISKMGSWDSLEKDHGKISHATIQPFLCSQGVHGKVAKYIATILGAHHGKIKAKPHDRGFNLSGISENKSLINWDECRLDCAKKVLDNLPCSLNSICLTNDSPELWWLAGLTTIADWIGSDDNFFSSVDELNNEQRLIKANNALSNIGFGNLQVKQNLSFSELFNFGLETKPNDIQIKAIEVINKPGVYVIEAPMGMGKTEAALWAAYNLIQNGKAKGIYFALPTQATSNRIHLRMTNFVDNISPDSISNKLIHGNSWLLEPSLKFVSSKDKDEKGIIYDWFASAKRSLLAPFGVGTIDQALMGVVSAKHFFVRHFALAGKVIIIDEVHSYDLYTGTLIDNLISILEGLGCTIIILSATLTGKRREQLISIGSSESIKLKELSYPLIVGKTNNKEKIIKECDTPLSREVDVVFKSISNCTNEAIDLAKKGGVVLWIANTVKSAQLQYKELISRTHGEFPIGLLHSRFPFWRREEIENEWMERLGKTSETRCGSILVSTQIVEQSVDLDADLIITELAPTDMLLQRMGRLWRHERNNRPIDKPTFYILEESKSIEELYDLDSKTIVKSFGSKKYIYSPYVLLRSLDVWKKQKSILIPSQIRSLIEDTYSEKAKEPLAWCELKSSMEKKFETYKQEAQRNSNFWQEQLKDLEGTQTRLNETPTVSLVLCKSAGDGTFKFIDNSEIKIITENFSLNSAKSIYKNIVKIPSYIFLKDFNYKKEFEPYLYGNQSVGLVEKNGHINIFGINSKINLNWSLQMGVEIIKENEEEI